LGYHFSNWTAKLARFHLMRHFGVKYSLERVRQLFHRLGFRRIRPGHALIASDPRERKRFKETISQLLKTKTRDTVVLWLDECTIKQHPTLLSLWSQKGTRPRVKTSGGHGKVHIFGAVDTETGKVHRNLSSSLKATAFKKFLKHLLTQYSTEKVVVIVDNAKAHHARLIHNFIERAKGHLKVVYLPKYSPDLNPIERLWKWLRQVVTHNFFFDSLNKLKRALQKFFAHVSKYPLIVKKTCSVKL
jgi:transposase